MSFRMKRIERTSHSFIQFMLISFQMFWTNSALDKLLLVFLEIIFVYFTGFVLISI